MEMNELVLILYKNLELVVTKALTISSIIIGKCSFTYQFQLLFFFCFDMKS